MGHDGGKATLQVDGIYITTLLNQWWRCHLRAKLSPTNHLFLPSLWLSPI